MGPFITAYPAVQNYIHRPPNRDHCILDCITNVNLNRKFHSSNGWTKGALSRAVKDVVGLRSSAKRFLDSSAEHITNGIDKSIATQWVMEAGEMITMMGQRNGWCVTT